VSASDFKIVSRVDLDAMKCANPECDHTACDGPLVLQPRCHPMEGVTICYEAGLIVAVCKVCDKFIVAVEVK
jgi:hypothetical protein